MNATTPTPSLNRDSLAIWVSTAFGAPALRMMANTDIGSVGEIRAPNRKQKISGNSMPNKSRQSHNAKPVRTVEANTPKVAKDPTVHLLFDSSDRSMWKAPANSRMDSTPSMSNSLKSIWRSTSSA